MGGGGVRAGLLERARYPIIALLLAGYLVVGWVGREPTMTKGADELTYLALSRSLEHGSYRETWFAAAPRHVKYPPAYPAWLVLVRKVTGDDHDRIRVSSLIIVGLGLLLFFSAARSVAGTRLALATLALIAFNREVLWAGGSLMSEGFFFVVSTAALAASLPSKGAARDRGAWVIGVALLAFLARSAGLALVLAAGVWLWMSRRRRLLPVYLLASALVVGGWFAYVAWASRNGGGNTYAVDVPRLPRAGAHLVLPSLAVRTVRTARSYLTTEFPFAVAVPTVRGTIVDNLAWVGVTVVLLAAGLVALWETWRIAAVYLVLYAGVLLAWPWADHRLVGPMVPLALLTMLLGARLLAGYLPARARGPALAAVWGLLALGALQGASQRLRLYRDCDRARPYRSAGCYDEIAVGMAAGSDALRQRAAPDDVVLVTNTKAATISFLSGHPTAPAEFLLGVPPDSTAAVLRARKIRFVFVTGMVRRERRELAKALLASCHELRFEGSFPPRAALFSTDPAESLAADACAPLGELVRQGEEESDEVYSK
jgi:hypothetical protein